jgi:putative hydrolase of the HAD superfamily
VTRAIVFDLDETLYPERRFALSGFAAVANTVQEQYGVPSRVAFGVLRRALASGRRAVAFQELATRFAWSDEVIETLTLAFRRHEPRLRLPRESATVLLELRRDWKIGVLTNGDPEIQARKVRALSLSSYVDSVVFAMNHGPGKPALSAFREALDQLECRASRAVFVGDNPLCDIAGARAAGIKTIRVRRGIHSRIPLNADDEADRVVESLINVPALAGALLDGVSRHVA